MKILKFGGTSLESPGRIRDVVAIVRKTREGSPVTVVVSAMGGVTDRLVEAARRASWGLDEYRETSGELRKLHHAAARELVRPSELERFEREIERRLGELEDLLHGVSLVRECSPRTMDQISSYGERLSADLVAAALRKEGVEADYLDARRLVVTDKGFGSAKVDTETTYENIRAHFAESGPLQVVTGFLGASAEGETTTLGRGGSDLTAALLGAALEAELIEIWTDVNGVMSADPRLVPEAFSLSELSYEELMELSHFGAKVVYPPTIHPARASGIPIVIRNTLRPELDGTRIVASAPVGDEPLRGISSIHEVALFRLEGDGMLGVPGTARRLFEALSREHVNVILITQASSEHSISFAVSPHDATRARASVEEEFVLERRAGLIDELVDERNLSVLAVVGRGMCERPGIAGRLFSVLGRDGVNVRAIAQGSSELNISLVVAQEDEKRALEAIHHAFFGSARRVSQLFLLGAGGVGSHLLAQIDAAKERLRATHGLELRLCGLGNSRQMRLERSGIDTSRWEDALGEGTATDLDTFARFAESCSGHRIFVDCTASSEVAALFEPVLARGVSVVSANKLPFAGSMSSFERLRNHPALYFEATVGAGLPVLHTLDTLVRTGDRIDRIEGVFSGTLSFLFHRLRQGAAFGDAVREAHDKGFTEPDPREDLSGMDVARKLLILARVAGVRLEPEDVRVESLLPRGEIRGAPLDEFWKQTDALSDAIGERFEAARACGKTLVYLAKLADGCATVGLEEVAPDAPAAAVEGTDNLFSFTTERYAEAPLVVRGSGAGRTVTASAVFADILQACAEAPR